MRIALVGLAIMLAGCDCFEGDPAPAVKHRPPARKVAVQPVVMPGGARAINASAVSTTVGCKRARNAGSKSCALRLSRRPDQRRQAVRLAERPLPPRRAQADL